VLAVAAVPQERAAKKTPADFGKTLDSAKKAWGAGDYGACMASLKEAISLVTVKRVETILAALPAAPEGFEIVPDKSMDQMRANQMMGAMAAAIGSTVTRDYRGPYRIRATVTADSPMVQMLNMWIANPATLDPDSELITYGPHKAVLKTTGGGKQRELMIVLNEKHVVQVDYASDDEDALFAMWDQAAIDKLAAALGK
jgi:hypothetical protein